MGAYPDYGKAPPEYIVGFAEALSYLSSDELAVVLHPKDGIATRCQYLPTIADIHAVLRDAKARQDQFKPAHTIYRRLNEDTGPWDQETDYERKARLVKELLGYNPSPKAQQFEARRELVPPTAEDIKNLRLKTPPAPPSRYLLDQLAAEGWPFLPQQDEAA